MLDLEHVVGGLLDGVGDGVAVRRAEQQRPEHEHVERAGQHVAGGVGSFPSSHARSLLQKKF